MTDTLRLEKTGRIATLTLSRPKAFNALNAEMRRALSDAVAEIEADADLRVVILKGEGQGFCAGADLKAGMPADVEAMLQQEYRPSLDGIARSSKIWIAQVHGTAAGIGVAYALNCDLIMMAEDAALYMAFAAIALVPDGGNTWLLMRAMGYQRALRAILEGQKITAQDCLSYGLVNEVITADTLEAETMALAERIAQTAPLAAAQTKKILRAADAQAYDAAFGAEAVAQNTLVKSHDFKEGVMAFLQKRAPSFQGK